MKTTTVKGYIVCWLYEITADLELTNVKSVLGLVFWNTDYGSLVWKKENRQLWRKTPILCVRGNPKASKIIKQIVSEGIVLEKCSTD